MGSFFKKLWSSVITILTSKKTLMAAATMAVQALPISQDTKHAMLVVGAGAILGQGAADLGKNAK